MYMEAGRDIRLTDTFYSGNGILKWSGQLRTLADLTLKAARAYPTTLSSFTLNAGGKVTILPADTPIDAPIFSAGGSLTIQAGKGVEQRGFLAAPMGTISLQATGNDARVYLADGSVTTTRGDVSVKYGDFQSALGDNIWGIPDKDHPICNRTFPDS